MTMTEHGYAVTLEFEANLRTVTDDAIAEIVHLLVNHGASVTGGTGYARWGATLSIRDASTPIDAAQKARTLVFAAAAAAGIEPSDADIVELQVLTFAEQDRQLDQPLFPDLFGVAELAGFLDVSKQRASELYRKPPPGFPQPIAVLKSGPIWAAPSLTRFAETWVRRPGRRATEPDLVVHQADGTALEVGAKVARSAGMAKAQQRVSRGGKYSSKAATAARGAKRGART